MTRDVTNETINMCTFHFHKLHGDVFYDACVVVGGQGWHIFYVLQRFTSRLNRDDQDRFDFEARHKSDTTLTSRRHVTCYFDVAWRHYTCNRSPGADAVKKLRKLTWNLYRTFKIAASVGREQSH